MTYILQRVCGFVCFGGRQVYFSYFSVTLVSEIKTVGVFGLFFPEVRTVVLGIYACESSCRRLSSLVSSDDTLCVHLTACPVCQWFC